MARELKGYDPTFYNILISGFKFGFRLGAIGTKANCNAKNHKSALDNPVLVMEKLAKEIIKGRISGPFKKPPFRDFICSPLGLVPKSVPGKYRLIHDLSFPKGNSVNSLIPPENSIVKYDCINNVVNLVKFFRQDALLSKCDIEDAFRIICLHPSDYHLLGFTWNHFFYFDKCLPMGASSSCQIFERFSSALQWIMEHKYGVAGMSHIIDDFLFVGPPNSSKCGQDLNRFLSLCEKLGVPIKDEKTVQPSTVITIYGIEVDSHELECRLPLEKIIKIKTALNTSYKRKKIKLRELQSLIGLLNFACLVVCPGRTFLRRLIDLTKGITNPSFYIRLNREARADLAAWKIFIDSFNGKSVFLSDNWLSSDHYRLYTDASGSVGYAAVFGCWWFAQKWPKDLEQHQIAVKELFPITLTLEIWGHCMENHKVLFLSDNQAIVEVINKKSCRDPILMSLVRRIVIAALHFNILFRAKHIPGKTNVVADHLSRFQFQKAKLVAPWLSDHQTVVPLNLLHI